MSYTLNINGRFEWNFKPYKTDDVKTFEEYIEQNPFTLELLKNKVQCFASKYSKNNCYEDMGFIASNGCICVLYSEDTEETEFNRQCMSIAVIRKEQKFEMSKKDFSYGANSHLFFEIPVVQNFTEHQFKKWLSYLARELSKKAKINVKRRQIWLRKKHLENDFDEIRASD